MNTPSNLYYVYLDDKPISEGVEDKDMAIRQCEILRETTKKNYSVIRVNMFGTGIREYPKGKTGA